jgi:antibiotic biosynthesis monooxygenase (ABM) superfamily enzyme
MAPISHRQTEPLRAPAPPRYKLALVTWAGAYAVITAILAALGPLMATWPLLLRTLLLSVLMVVAMTWLVIPSLTRLFRGWLVPRVSRSAASVEARSGGTRRCPRTR